MRGGQTVKRGRRGEANYCLDLIIQGPDVSCQRVGAALDGPGRQGELVAEQVGVRLGLVAPEGLQVVEQTLEAVGAGVQQDVTEGGLFGRDVGRQEVPFHLEKRGERERI